MFWNLRMLRLGGALLVLSTTCSTMRAGDTGRPPKPRLDDGKSHKAVDLKYWETGGGPRNASELGKREEKSRTESDEDGSTNSSSDEDRPERWSQLGNASSEEGRPEKGADIHCHVGVETAVLHSDDTQDQEPGRSEGVTILDIESPTDDNAKGCWDSIQGCYKTIFSWSSWRKMFSWKYETPTCLRRFISCLTLTSLGIATLVPYIRHHDLGMMNASLVDTISSTLATHQVWSKTWGTIGTFFGALAFWNLWKRDVTDTWYSEKIFGVQVQHSGCDKALTGLSLTCLTVGAIAQLGVIWTPIGGALSSIHKYCSVAFFVPTATGMLLYACISARKTGFCNGWRKVWRTWLYVFLALCIASFAFTAPGIEKEKNQMKMTVPDCVLENPDHAEVCTNSGAILPKDSQYGDCRPERPNYEVPMKKKYECAHTRVLNEDGEFEDLDLDGFENLEDAKAGCEAAQSLYSKNGVQTMLDEPCYLTNTDLGGWMKNIGICESSNKELQGPTDTCRNAKARDLDGKIDNAVFAKHCAAAKDVDGNECDYTPAAKSEAAWTLFSVLEMISFSGALLMFGFILTGE